MTSHNSPRNLEGRPTCKRRWNGGYRNTTQHFSCHLKLLIRPTSKVSSMNYVHKSASSFIQITMSALKKYSLHSLILLLSLIFLASPGKPKVSPNPR